LAPGKRELMGPEPVFLLEAKRNPDLGRKYFEMGPARMRGVLEDIIQAWVDRGHLKVADTKEAAEDLAMLCQGFLPIELQIFPDLTLTDDEIEHRVVRGVDKFLKIYRSP
ncbi:MAG: TetR/AcrR family transcriptional regulator C-terminal domain-containing protein, partial [Pseudomonadota bacterium]